MLFKRIFFDAFWGVSNLDRFLFALGCPKSAQERHNSAQERPKSTQERPKSAPRAPQERPRSGQERPERGPRAAKSSPRAANRGPRAAKSGPTAAKNRPKGAKSSNKRCLSPIYIISLKHLGVLTHKSESVQSCLIDVQQACFFCFFFGCGVHVIENWQCGYCGTIT